jgi:hypothetical protein
MLQYEPSEYFIKTPKIFGAIKKEIAKLWGIKQKLTHFPGSQPRALCRTDLVGLQKYAVTEKTDGVRFSLLLTTIDNKLIAVLVNRLFHMYQLQIIAPTVYFQGTLLEGELIQEHTFLKLLLFDITALSGKPVHHFHFFKRYEMLNNLCASNQDWNYENIFADIEKQKNTIENRMEELAHNHKIIAVPTKKKCFFIYSKGFYIYKGFMNSLLRSCKDIKHKTDGFVFTPINAASTAQSLKWKYKPTIDLEIQFGALMFCRLDGLKQSFGHSFPAAQFVTDDTFLSYMQFEGVLEISVRLKSPPQTFLLSVMRPRKDKRQANDIKTIQSVFVEVQENIEIEELLQGSIV